MDAPQYTFTTIEDLLTIPAEKIDHALEDLRLWVHAIQLARALVDAGWTDDSELRLSKPAEFVWIDDGKHDCEIQISVARED